MNTINTMNTIQPPAPLIIPVNHANNDNGSWKAHVMHCPECKKIYDDESSAGHIALVFLCVFIGLFALVPVIAFAIKNMTRLLVKLDLF